MLCLYKDSCKLEESIKTAETVNSYGTLAVGTIQVILTNNWLRGFCMSRTWVWNGGCIVLSSKAFDLIFHGFYQNSPL